MIKKHAILHDELTRDIRSGRYAVGAALPSETALVRRFGVSRITVQRALRDLERDGLIRKIQRKGAYVSPTEAGERVIEIYFPPAIGEADVEIFLKSAARAAEARGCSVIRVKERKGR